MSSISTVRSERSGRRRSARARLASSESGPSSNLAHVQGRIDRAGPLDQRSDEVVEEDVFGAEGRDEQCARLPRLPQQFLKRECALGVAPLQIVDDEHDRTLRRQAPQQLAQRIEGFPPDLDRVEAGHRALHVGLDEVPEHGEHVHERVDMLRHEAPTLVRQKRVQVPAQLLDDAVERLVRNRFPHVTTALQEQRAVGKAIAGEPLRQRRLAEAARSMKTDENGVVAPDVANCRFQGGDLRFPAQRCGLAHGRRARRPGRPRLAAKTRQHVGATRAACGVA